MSSRERVSPSDPLPQRLRLSGDGAGWRGALLGIAFIAGGVAALRLLGRGPGPALAGVCFTAGIVTLIVAWLRRVSVRNDRALLDAMSAGDYIAFWIVPPNVWQEHLARERAAEPNAARLATIAGFGIGAAVAALVVGIHWSQGTDVSGYLLPAAGLVAGTTVVFGLVGAGMRLLQGARLRRLSRREAAICIADRGLFHAGELWPHDRGIPRFLGVELIPGSPRLLAFSYRFSSPKGSYTEVVRVPMPPTDAVIRPDEILQRLNRS